MLNVNNLSKKATKARALKVNESSRQWVESCGEKKIAHYFEDPDGIFSTENGYKAGVYEVSVVISAEREIGMYIGEVGKQGRGFIDRLTEHARYWIENTELYTGVKLSELDNGYKFKVRILAEETDYDKRYELEQAFVEQRKPYLQYNCYSKYDSKYRGFDLAIFVTWRRRAFIVARDGKYTEEKRELFVEGIYEANKNVDFNEFRKATPNQDVVALVEKEMPKGSEIWMQLKRVVEKNMGIDSERGCQYSYLVRIIAAVLEPRYKAEAVS